MSSNLYFFSLKNVVKLVIIGTHILTSTEISHYN